MTKNYRRFPLGALWTNSYLFFGGSDAFLIDPGGDAHGIISYLESHGLKLRAVLMTHGHLDHLAGINKLVPIVGGEIYIAEADAPLLRHPPEDVQTAMGMYCRGIETFKTVSDSDALTIGEFSVKVIATPGHTPGSVCYMISHGDENILASGDTLFAQSVGRTDLTGGDHDELMRSLVKLAALPDELQVLPGHGPATTIGRERESNPYWPR